MATSKILVFVKNISYKKNQSKNFSPFSNHQNKN